jgi:large repetitive protein
MRRALPIVSILALVACSAPAGQEVSKSVAAVDSLNLRAIGRAKGWSDDVSSTLVLDNVHEYAPGVRVAQVSQRIAGFEVFLGGFGMILGRDGSVTVSGKPVETVHPASTFKLDPITAVRAAAIVMTGVTPSTIAPMQGNGDYAHFDVRLGGELLVQSARSKPVWFQGKRLTAAYYVELDVARIDSTDSVVHSFVISAVDGEVLFENDLTANDAYTYKAYAETAGTFVPWAGPHGSTLTPHPTGTLDSTTVTPKDQQNVTLQNSPFSKNDPWLPPAATKTDGNNVVAYADLVAPDGFGGTDPMPATTSASTFDFTYDATKNPNATPTNIDAVSVHLFYVGNYMHDWFYDAGFNEASRNHQADNLGRGGVARDPLKMEAQDYSGRNNANATTPADGGSPRIQMFLFNGAGRSTLTVKTPDALAGGLTTRSAPFGPSNYDITADVVLVDDGGGTTSDGCEKPFVNAASVKGKIALIDRGTCAFTDKVLNAEAAGAVGVLIANNTATGGAPYLGGTAGVAIKIPTMSISLADGTKLKDATAPSVRMFREQAPDRDGGLDTGIVSHEWGHVLTNRLVGNGNGLVNTQGGGLGEGWGDFTALMTTVHASDITASAAANWNGTYSMGGWVDGASGAGSYFGIRRYPYSADMMKNPLTFKHIQNGTKLSSDAPIAYGESGSNNAEVHATGEVWASMMWQCYVGILRDKRHTYEEASKRMRSYYVAGLKITPVNPTIIQARDALLTAMYAADQEDFKTCAKGFADRGAGVGATGPDAASRTNVGVKESFAVGGDIDVESITLAETTSCDEDGTLDNGETGTVTIKVRNIGTETIEAASGKLTSKSGNFVFAGDGKIALPTMKPFESVEVKAEVTLNNAAPVSKQDIEVAIEAMGLAVPRVITASLPLVVDSDTKLESSTVDTVDTEQTTWKVTSGKTTWTRVKEGINQRWSIIGNPDRSDRSLVSPPLVVSADKPLVMTFKHRHSFEQSRSLNWDGGVLEISADDGVTWVDAGTSVYNGTLTTTDNDNPLKGRKAFVFRNAGYPEFASVTVDLGTTYAGKTVLVRFRSGTDEGTASGAWDVDDIGFDGITNTPFASRVGDETICGTTPDPDAGPGPSATPDQGPDTVTGGKCGCEVPGHHSGSALPVLALIALAITRRKRETC